MDHKFGCGLSVQLNIDIRVACADIFAVCKEVVLIPVFSTGTRIYSPESNDFRSVCADFRLGIPLRNQ